MESNKELTNDFLILDASSLYSTQRFRIDVSAEENNIFMKTKPCLDMKPQIYHLEMIINLDFVSIFNNTWKFRLKHYITK